MGDLLRIATPDDVNGDLHANEYRSADRWTGQLEAFTKQGNPLRIERRRTRVLDRDDVIGEVVLDLDLGCRIRLERVERRRQRLESVVTLASGITHDLNNLLTPILMSSRMLRRGGEHLDRDAILETIIAAAGRGADLNSQLLTAGRMLI